MLVYAEEHGERDWRAWSREILDLLDGVPSRSTFEQVFIDFGELESGIVDAVHPAEDACTELTGLLRRAGLHSARLLLGRTTDVEPLRHALQELNRYSIPQNVPMRR